MKKIVISLAVLTLSVGLFAQGAKPKTNAKCPVMPSHSISIAKATKDKLFADYKGRRYFFCCAGCVPAFKKNPEKYIKGADSIPIPKKG